MAANFYLSGLFVHFICCWRCEVHVKNNTTKNLILFFPEKGKIILSGKGQNDSFRKKGKIHSFRHEKRKLLVHNKNYPNLLTGINLG